MKILLNTISILILIIVILIGCTDPSNEDETNSAPTDIILSSTSILEDQPSGTNIGTITIIDSDTEDVHILTLIADFADNSSFTIEDTILKTSETLWFENNNQYSIKIRCTDEGGLSFEKEFTITLTRNENIIFYDRFNRPNTLDGDLGNDIWGDVLFPTNTVFIQNYELLFGTVNSGRPVISTVDSYDIDCNCEITVDFQNLGFGIWLGNEDIVIGIMPSNSNFVILYPEVSTPAATEISSGSITQDNWFKLKVTKTDYTFQAQVLDGESILDTVSYIFPGTVDFSQMNISIDGGGDSGFGTYVYVDNIKIIKI